MQEAGVPLGSPQGVVEGGESERGEFQFNLEETPLRDWTLLGGLFSSFGVPRKGCEKGLANYARSGALWAPLGGYSCEFLAQNTSKWGAKWGAFG